MSIRYAFPMNPLPALRNVDIFPLNHEGKDLICLHDSEGYVEAQLLMSPSAFFIGAQLDGRNTIAEVQEAFAAQFSGHRPTEDEIMTVVKMLSDNGFLIDATFSALALQVQEDFAASDHRAAWLADKSYPADPEELRTMIDGFFTGKDGPGALPVAGDPTADPLACLVVPHIDFHRGAPSYAHGYRALMAHGKPDTVFVFGVAHQGAPMPFVLTRKDFATPFGTVETDRAIVDRLAGACDWDPFEYEIVHRTEHSIEFQAVMLAYLYGPDVKIVPILAACFSENPQLERPETEASVDRFLTTCAEIAAAPERRVSVIAGADLAHVGKRFGDDFDIDDAITSAVSERDLQDLAHVVTPDAEDFYASVMRDRNARRVCGIGCIYAALRTANQVTEGDILHYGYAPDPAGGIVSYASVALG